MHRGHFVEQNMSNLLIAERAHEEPGGSISFNRFCPAASPAANLQVLLGNQVR